MTEKPVVEEKPLEFTKEELSIVAQLLAQAPVKVADAPPFLAMLKKTQEMIGQLDRPGQEG